MMDGGGGSGRRSDPVADPMMVKREAEAVAGDRWHGATIGMDTRRSIEDSAEHSMECSVDDSVEYSVNGSLECSVEDQELSAQAADVDVAAGTCDDGETGV